MSNRIIKVSIVLIFIMFSACLFNFCFALTLNENKFIDGGNLPSDIPEFNITTWDGVTKPLTGSGYGSTEVDIYTDAINSGNYKIMYGTFTNSSNVVKNFCFITLLNPNYANNIYTLSDLYFYYNTSNGMSYSTADKINLSNGPTYEAVFYYNENGDNKWNLWRYDGFVLNFPATIYQETNIDFYNGYAKGSLWYEANLSVPSVEELIAGCDFNVRIEFGDSEELSSNYPIKNHLGMQKVTIIHSLTNWKYYDIKLDITLEDYGFWINQRFHYAHYSTNMTSDEFKDVDTICIEEPTSINLSPNDYLGIYSAKAGKYVRLQYKIYNKSTNELLLTRTIRFRFDGDGFFILQDSSDVSGTILEDSLKDNSGNDIDNNSNNIISNGKDLTDINTDFDFSSGFKLDVDTLKGTLENSIESSKTFFNLFSTFLGLLPIWISTLLYFFLFGVIVITLYRFIRGA